jgi:hypothetical protein
VGDGAEASRANKRPSREDDSAQQIDTRYTTSLSLSFSLATPACPRLLLHVSPVLCFRSPRLWRALALHTDAHVLRAEHLVQMCATICARQAFLDAPTSSLCERRTAASITQTHIHKAHTARHCARREAETHLPCWLIKRLNVAPQCESGRLCAASLPAVFKRRRERDWNSCALRCSHTSLLDPWLRPSRLRCGPGSSASRSSPSATWSKSFGCAAFSV